jgi:hypothetical protein
MNIEPVENVYYSDNAEDEVVSNLNDEFLANADDSYNKPIVNDSKNNVILETIGDQITFKGWYEQCDGDNVHKLDLKCYIILHAIIEDIKFNPNISIKDLRNNLKPTLEFLKEEFKKTKSSNMHSKLIAVTNFELDSSLSEHTALDFFINKLTGKFGNGSVFIVGEYNPIENDLLTEEVNERSIRTETAVNVGVFSFHIDFLLTPLDDY